MQIYGFQKTTLLDYPGHLAATIFLGGCDFRCPFCHNGSLVLCPNEMDAFTEEEVLDVLKKRNMILEGVCITGGEPTLQKDLPEFIAKIKSLGLKVKLDTNGNHPSMLQQLIERQLIDYIAMDIKNSKEKYDLTTGKYPFPLHNVEQSVSYIMNCGIDYEFRTTVVKELHKPEDFAAIGVWIQGAQNYYLQSFTDSDDILSGSFTGYTKKELVHIKTIVEPYVQMVELRGIDS